MDLERFVSPGLREMRAYHVALPKVRCKLNQNEAPGDFPPELKQVILEKVQKAAWNRYPDLRPEAVREILAQSRGVHTGQVFLGKGSNEILQGIMTLTAGSGATAIITPPTFSMIDHLLKVFAMPTVEVPLGEGFAYPLEQVLEAARKVEKPLILLASPNNPTGTWTPRETVEALLRESKGLVVLDQAYIHYADETLLDLLEEHDNLVITRTFSKAFRLGGCRLGYCLAHERFIEHLGKAIVPFNIDHFSAAAFTVALQHPEPLRASIRSTLMERDRVFAGIADTPGLEPTPSMANFILFAADQGLNVYDTCLEQSVLLRPFGALRDDREWLRVTIGKPSENDRFLECLRTLDL